MRSILILLTTLVIQNPIFNQNPESSIWFVGSEPRSVNSTKSVATLDFSSEQLTIKKRDDITGISFLGNSSSICSKEGELLFYSDGCFIYNSENKVMEGGDRINDGEFWSDYCVKANSYPSGHASTMILPAPKDADNYYLLHQTVEQFWPDEYSRVYYSKIDMSANNSLGEVVEKNHLILLDSTYLGEMAAVQHANENDWWIVVPEDSNNVYNVLLLDSTGTSKSHEQNMGNKIEYYGMGTGQCKFSPDGRKFARWTFTRQLLLADFDRISGTFSNFSEYHVQDSVSRGGIEFSPDSRFLYVSSGLKVDQFDLLSNDFESSKVTIGTYDGFEDILPTEFRRMQLTPDCRIFINSPGGHRYWHIIQNPNEKGLACNLEQHSLLLPTRTFNTMPYFPNYSLGSIGNEGYPCDSTKITVSSSDIPIFKSPGFVYPNPTQGQLRIDLPAQAGQVDFRLFSAAGQLVFSKEEVFAGEEMGLYFLPKGIYFYKIFDKKGRAWSGKVVIN